MTSQLGCTNRTQRDIIEIIKCGQRIVTQFTDTVFEIHKPIDAMVQRLLSPDACLSVMVSGHGKCGKSELINALLGETLLQCSGSDGAEVTTHFPLRIKAGISDIPLLHGASGRPLAVEVPSIREWIRAENTRQHDAQKHYHEASKKEARIHHQYSLAGLPRPEPQVFVENTDIPVLECTPFFLRDMQCELEVSIMDTCRDTPFASTRQRGHVAYDADVFTLMIDYWKLKTEQEADVFSVLPQSALLPLHAERYIFVVVNADALFLNTVIDDSEPFKSVAEVKSYVLEMLRPLFGKVSKEQVLVLYGKLAVHARIVHHNKGEVPLEILYDYCELGYGSQFMQTVDKIPLEELQMQSTNHASERLQSSGLLACERAFRTVGFNGGSLFLLSVASEAYTLFSSFSAALEGAHPGLQKQQTVTEEELEQLLTEQDFIGTRLEQVRTITSLMRTELESLLEESLGSFWESCFAQLKDILHGADIDSFKLRQKTAAGDVIRHVAYFKEFVETRYIRDRRFIESRERRRTTASDDDRSSDDGNYKFCDEEDSVGHSQHRLSSSLPDAQSRNGTPPSEASAPDAKTLKTSLNEDALMTAVDHIVEENALFLDVNRAGFLDAIQSDLASKVLSVGQAFTHFVKDELQLVLPALVEVCLVRKEQLSEMLLNKAVGLLEATQNRLGKSMDLNELLSHWKDFNIVAPDERVLNNFVRELPYEATDIFVKTLLPTINIGAEVSEATVSAKITEAVLAAWSEVLTTKDTYAVTTYDRVGVAACLDSLRHEITSYVSAYSDDIASSISTQQEQLDLLTSHRDELNAQQHLIKVPLEELHGVVHLLREGVQWDYDAAAAIKEDQLGAED